MRPTVVEIDLSALAYNIKNIQNRVAPAGILAVIKANAYGHGALEIGRIALENDVRYFGVACVEEGIELRQAGFENPILVFSGINLNQAQLYLQHDLEATLVDSIGLNHLTQTTKEQQRQALVQIKVDTGMGRMGISWRDAVPFIEHVAAQQRIKINGVYTHFANSDQIDKSFALLQLARFKHILQQLEDKQIHIPLRHSANSGAILDLTESYFDLVRPGILLYGHYPSDSTSESISVQPVMSFKTRVLAIKELERGESVSYDRTFIAQQKTRIAALPVGYADGYPRLLSNSGVVLIRGERFPIVGRVSMDISMVDLGLRNDIQVGDPVILFGRQEQQEVTLESFAAKSQTVHYEIICGITGRVPRIYT